MKQIHVRLGPLALLLTVIVICMTVLGLLAVTTAMGDLSIARRYAESVEDRYALEARGQKFLWQAARDPGELELLDMDEEGIRWKVLSKDGMSLQIGLEGQEGRFRVVSWQFVREDWEPQETMDGLWSGE